jgi:predicted nucleic acid-binding protein
MMDNVAAYVLDAFAMLAFFRDEPAAQRVEELLTESAAGRLSLRMTVVNAGEVYYRTVREFNDQRAEVVAGELRTFAIELVDVSDDLAMAAARIKGIHPISYADCLVAALAQRTSATVLTGDPDFHRLEHLVKVEWLHSPR